MVEPLTESELLPAEFWSKSLKNFTKFCGHLIFDKNSDQNYLEKFIRILRSSNFLIVVFWPRLMKNSIKIPQSTTAAFLTRIFIDILEEFPNHRNSKFYKIPPKLNERLQAERLFRLVWDTLRKAHFCGNRSEILRRGSLKGTPFPSKSLVSVGLIEKSSLSFILSLEITNTQMNNGKVTHIDIILH